MVCVEREKQGQGSNYDLRTAAVGRCLEMVRSGVAFSPELGDMRFVHLGMLTGQGCVWSHSAFRVEGVQTMMLTFLLPFLLSKIQSFIHDTGRHLDGAPV